MGIEKIEVKKFRIWRQIFSNLVRMMQTQTDHVGDLGCPDFTLIGLNCFKNYLFLWSFLPSKSNLNYYIQEKKKKRERKKNNGLTFFSKGKHIWRLIFFLSSGWRWGSGFCGSTSLLSSSASCMQDMISCFIFTSSLWLEIHNSISRSLILIFCIISSDLSVFNCMYVCQAKV